MKYVGLIDYRALVKTSCTYLVLAMSTGMDAMVVTSPLIILVAK